MCSPTRSITALLTLFFSSAQVYICGGLDGTECLITAEVYNATTDQWTVIAPMGRTRRGAGVTAYGNEVYVVRETRYRCHTTLQSLWHLLICIA